jgi:hypothetical protein
MITKSELQAVNEEMLAERRRALGAPPTNEELFAYMRGELSADDEARVRELLICHPELANAMALPFPTDDARLGEPGFVSDADLTKQWTAFRRSVQSEPVTRVVSMRSPWATAIAAALALVFAGLYWQSESALRRVAQPHIGSERQVLMSDGRRGGEPQYAPIPSGGDALVLEVPIVGDAQQHYPQYRLELVDAETKRTVWSSPGETPSVNNTFTIILQRSLLTSSRYTVALYGSDGVHEDRIANYTFRTR